MSHDELGAMHGEAIASVAKMMGGECGGFSAAGMNTRFPVRRFLSKRRRAPNLSLAPHTIHPSSRALSFASL